MNKNERHVSPLTIVTFFFILNYSDGTMSNTELIVHIVATICAAITIAYPDLRTTFAWKKHFHWKQDSPVFIHLGKLSECNVTVVGIKETTETLTTDDLLIIDEKGAMYSLSAYLGGRYVLNGTAFPFR